MSMLTLHLAKNKKTVTHFHLYRIVLYAFEYVACNRL